MFTSRSRRLALKLLALPLLAAALLLPKAAHAQLPTFDYLQEWDHTTRTVIRNPTADSAGNIYMLGQHLGPSTDDLDPGAGVVNHTAASGRRDLSIVKLDPSGNFIFAKIIELSNANSVREIKVDSNDNVIVHGSYTGSSDFDPGPGTFNMSASGALGFFVVKLDPNGDFLWAREADGFSANAGQTNNSAINSSDEIVIVGQVGGSNAIDVDPGPGTFLLNSPPSNLHPYVWTLDANGDFVSAWEMTGSPFQVFPTGVAIDSSDNVTLAVGGRATIDYDPGPGVFNLTTFNNQVGAQFAQYTASGTLIWANQLLNTSGNSKASRVAVDSADNLYFTGNFRGTFDLDPGPGQVLATATGVDGYVVKLDSSGNYVNSVTLSSVSTVFTSQVVIDGSDNVYVNGSFRATVDFDPGPGVENRTSSDTQDTFLWKLDTNLNLDEVGITQPNEMRSLSLDPLDNILISFSARAAEDVDPGAGVETIPAAGTFGDSVLVKLGGSAPVDTTPPVITLTGGDETLECSVDTYTEQGATATDDTDGDISGDVVIGGDTVDPSMPDTYVVTYDVSDAAGNAAAQVTRTVTVEDTTPPTITLNGGDETLECPDSYTELGAMANDLCDGDLTGSIVVGGDVVDTSTPGIYSVTYNVSDTAGNAATEVTRTVTVEDTGAPVIGVESEALSLWPPNNKFNTIEIEDFVTSVSDGCDTVSIADVVISSVSSDEPAGGNVDIEIAGDCKSVKIREQRDGSGDGRVYIIHVEVKDASGNVGSASFNVEVAHSVNGTATDSGVSYTVDGCDP